MTLKRILTTTDLINDHTEIYIRNKDSFHVYAYGNWFQDCILDYMEHEITSFTWEDENTIFIDIE